jgi:hypothetical protein
VRPAVSVIFVSVVLAAFVAGCGGADRSVPGRPLIVQDDAELLFRSPARVRAGVELLKAVGADWVRLTAFWSLIAPQPGAVTAPRFDASDPDAYGAAAWRPLDTAVRAARDAGLKVAIDVGFWAPRWAVARPAKPADRQRDGIDPQRFSDFASAVARRYPDAVAFTVWNEPNSATFLLPQPADARTPGSAIVASADEYRAMLDLAVPAIRHAAPQALVLIGGLAPRAAANVVAPLRFLRDLACVDDALRPRHDGACARFAPLPGDGFAHHPYPAPGARPADPPDGADNVPVSGLAHLADVLDALHARGRTQERLAVWVNEFGLETNPPDPTQPLSPVEAARQWVQSRTIALRDPRVRSFSQFLIRDLPPREGVPPAQRWADVQSGLLDVAGKPKPLLAAVARVSGGDVVTAEAAARVAAQAGG